MRRRLAVLPAACLLLAATLFACSREKNSELPDSPDGTIRYVATGLAESRPEVLWRALPESYQKDVTALVHDAAAKGDPEVWKRSFGVLAKVSTILADKRDFILDHPMLQGKIKDRASLEENWGAVVGMFDVLVKSELADPSRMATLDVERFLAGTGSKLMKHATALSGATNGGPSGLDLASLAKVEASVVSSSGDTARVRVKHPSREATEEDYVRVEGRWLPKRLADGWPQAIAQARQRLDAYSSEESARSRQALLMQLGMIDGVLDALIATKTAEEFNAALGTAFGSVLGAVMAQAQARGAGQVSVPGIVLSPADATDGRNDAPPVPTPAPVSGLPLVASMQKDAPAFVPESTPGQRVELRHAEKYVGTALRVVGKNGLDFTGILTSTEPGALVFSRQIGVGSVTFDMRVSDIESLFTAQ